MYTNDHNFVDRQPSIDHSIDKASTDYKITTNIILYYGLTFSAYLASTETFLKSIQTML
jgi:hypothetical protein